MAPHSISHHLPAGSLRIPQPPKNPFQNYLTSITSTHATDHQHCRWTCKSHSCVCPLRCGLQTPPTSQYPVAVRTNKHFTVTVNGRNTTISIDRLKPVHLDLESNTEHSLATTKSLPNEQSHHIPVSSHLPPHSHSPLPPSHTSTLALFHPHPNHPTLHSFWSSCALSPIFLTSRVIHWGE